VCRYPCLGGCAQQGAVGARGCVVIVTSTLLVGLPRGIALCFPQAADLGAREENDNTKRRAYSGGTIYCFPRLQAQVVDKLCISGQTMSNPGMKKGFFNVNN
jgi:hypothetical protein